MINNNKITLLKKNMIAREGLAFLRERHPSPSGSPAARHRNAKPIAATLSNISNTTTPIIFFPGMGFKHSITRLLDIPFDHIDFSTLFWKKELTLEHLANLIPKNSTLIAWSLGGLFAIDFCSKFPTHCRKLILLASTPAFLIRNNWPGISNKNALILQEVFSKRKEKFDSRFLSLVQFPNHSASLRDELRQYYETPKEEIITYLFQTDLRDAFATLTLPVHLYMGENDAILPSNEVIAAAEKLNPRIETTLIKNGSHAFFIEQKHFFNGLIL